MSANDIPPKYIPNPPDQRAVTPADLAEAVTPASLPDLLMILAEKSQNEEYLVNILDIAAKKLDRPTGALLREFREYQNKGDNKLERFRFLSVGDLYSKSGPTDWVVKSYLDKKSLAMIFGRSGDFKSFVAIDIGCSVATGIDWHGHPVGQGAVFYICGEGLMGISRRLRAWEIHHGMSLDNEPFFTSDRPAQFLSEESAIEVVAAVNVLCDQHGKPALIIIDTLNRNFGPGEEGDTADMTKFVQVVDSALRRTFGCSVLIIHHTGHKEKHRARGSSALHAALDWEYKAAKNDKILHLMLAAARKSQNWRQWF